MTAPAGVRSERRALGVFGATIFCGSFLLFLVQPIVAKELLPWFGGAANVWATCLVFFQLGLLLGYAYADALTRRVAVARQGWVHVALILAAGAMLPIVPAAHWKPQDADNPSLRVLGALATTVGLPYVVMAAASPLLSTWYARRFPARSPYRLFALSNLASMAALIAYPATMEPWLGTRWQIYAWSAGYLLWALLIGLCAASLRGVPLAEAASAPAAEEKPAPPRYLAWAGLAALGSFLLVAVTNYLTRDVAAIPLLWVVPLAVYLLSFIASFQQRNWLTPFRLDCFGLGALLLYGSYEIYSARIDHTLPIDWQVAVYCVVLGSACLYCHGRLALTRPAPAYLTRFYLTIALGGAGGAALIGLAAPALLHVDFDLEGGMLITAVVLTATLWRARPRRRTIAVAATFAAALTVAGATLSIRDFFDGTVLSRRNFYGALRVYDWNGGSAGLARSLSNGVILHGTQYLGDAARRRPTEYYAEASGVGHAIAALRTSPAPRRIGVIGLGAGTLAAYGRRGDVIRFYELNPTVVGIARDEFTFLSDSAARVEIALGDARLNLERESPQDFDLLVIDAFSSDAIPVHLLTHEALELYLRHVRRDGIVAFHISNRYIDLEPVVQRLAQGSGLETRVVDADVDDTFNTPSTWVLASRRSASLDVPGISSVARPIAPNTTRLWTDDFSDLLEFLR